MAVRQVLDKGYVRLVTYTPWNMVGLAEAIHKGDLEEARRLLEGHDLSAINAARASFAKEKDALSEGDMKLLRFLAEAEPVAHSSPFRHNHVTLEVYAPLFVCRQWWRHAVGAATLEEGTPWSELCLPGHQALRIFTKKSGRKYTTVAEVAKLSAAGKPLPVLRSVDNEGNITSNRVKSCWSTGTGRVYRVTLENGFTVESTMGHRYLTPTGYRRLENLQVGDTVMANGVAAYRDREWLENQYLTRGRSWEDIAQEVGCSVHTIHKWCGIFGLKTEGPVARVTAHNGKHGPFGKGETAKTNPALAERGRKVREKLKGVPRGPRGEDHPCWKGEDVTRYGAYSHSHRYAARETVELVCEGGCGATEHLERHHRDENPWNNDPSNIMIACKGYHDLTHGRETLLRVHPLKVAAIEYVGEMEVFDIEMENEPNFVAGGVVVHNSRRYVRGNIDYYLPQPEEWRAAPANAKQGSGGMLLDNAADTATWATQGTVQMLDDLVAFYESLVSEGVAPEQARMVLPQNIYTSFRWSPSVQALANFLVQRLDDHAQKEIQLYAGAVLDLVRPIFPHSLTALAPVQKA